MEKAIRKEAQMQNMDIMSLERKQLANAEDIVIDTEQSQQERMASYIRQMGNPFAQNIGEYLVQVDFAEDTEDTIEDRMILLAKRKLQIDI